MSGLDYSTFSLCSALTPSQPVPASTKSYPADPTQQHVAEDVIDSHLCHTQRDDLPSSTEMTDCPRDRPLATFEPYQGQGPSDRAFAFPGSPLLSDSADDIQGNILCAQLGRFHFTPNYTGGAGAVHNGHGTGEDFVNPPTAIMENASWSSQHSLHYPTPVHGSVSPSIKSAGPIPEDARPELSLLHCDVNIRVPARRASMAMEDRPFGRNYDFGLASASSPLTAHMTVDVSTFLPGGVMTSPSPTSTAYQDDDFMECAHTFTYAEHLPGMTPTTAHEPASQYAIDRQNAAAPSSLGAFHEPAHPSGITPLDHRYASDMATPLPGYSSSQSPHDHPICEPPCFGTAMHAEEELPRPGSAPPLMDNQVPFIGDARAALSPSAPENAASPSEHLNGTHRPHASWYHYPPPLAPPPSQAVAGQSPRSSPRRAGSIGHNSQKTPPGSRHLRRWSSVTNPALRGSPPFASTSFSPNVVSFPRYHPAGTGLAGATGLGSGPAPSPSAPVPVPTSSDNNSPFAHFSPSAESDSEDSSMVYSLPHAAVDVAESVVVVVPSDQPQPQPPPQLQPTARTVVRCDGHLIDEESWSAAFARTDKLLHVYECLWDLAHTPCSMWIEGDQSSVADHLALFHGFRGGEVTTRCLWHACPKPHMKGTSIARHVVTHIGSRVKCHTCKHEFARVDACNRAHSRSGCLGVGQPMYGDLQHVLDARKVDPLQRPCKKRRTDE